ncbi:MAG: DUF1449 family protein [Gomphosphaeria aponina SAG 52.96 = DSM 107014]|uniref:DUF1449 family protein n=1 Tax=Gomphosphaeria aponina SAG 52.96 = DSM 107014 TaxID=1521640 RepID=A0A941JTN6_9CHRO|nr:DUF1449 family protein [Gomphosphaeria aponina SAG 52.96 = DSM 107014]
MLFHPANLSYWIFLGIGVLLFLLVIFSGGGDNDLEVETDVDADIEGDFSPGEILGWLGIGEAPLILLLAIDFSIWGVTGWMLNVGIGKMIGTIPGGIVAGGIMFTSLCVSLFMGKVISRPLGKIFVSFSEDVSSDRFLGCVGTVVSKKLPYLSSGKIGQADVRDIAGNLVTISVSIPQWSTVIPHQGQAILIIEQTPDCYLAIAKDSSDEDKWLEALN